METVIDTDVLVALSNVNDTLHSSAKKLIKRVIKQKIQIFILPTTMAEFALLASSKIGVRETKSALDKIKNSNLIIDINQESTLSAISKYKKQTSKEESLFDCFIMVLANDLGIDYILSFDKGYKKKINGFKLMNDYLK